MSAAIYTRLNRNKQAIKDAVRAHWESEPCESRAGEGAHNRAAFFDAIDAYRYEKSPFIWEFARFAQARDKHVLEVGLGSGSDLMRWVKSGALVWGRDLSDASVKLVQERLRLEDLEADVKTGDVEALEFEDEVFDIVYAYGVIHHTPDTPRAVREIHRVLRSGGVARVMIYNAHGLSVFYQWILFGLLRMQPWRSPREIVFYHNESLGTKVYTRREARELFKDFKTLRIFTVIDSGDTLNFTLSERYRQVWLIRVVQRSLGFLRYLRRVLPARAGTTMLIEATK